MLLSEYSNLYVSGTWVPRMQAEDTAKALAVLSKGMDCFTFFVHYAEVLL